MTSTSIGDLNCKAVTQNYLVNFHDHHINTVLTQTASIVEGWISTILKDFSAVLNNRIVGLDVKPNPKKNEKEKVSVLQLCVDSQCLMIQVMHIDKVPKSLLDFLGNPSFTFVGVGIADNVAKLSREYELRIANAVDLRNLAAQKYNKSEMKEMGLGDLTEAVLGLNLVKPKEEVSNWDAECLTYEQVEYACHEVVAAFKMGKNLMATKSCSVTFEHEIINTVLTRTASIVEDWISTIRKDFRAKLNNLIVGFDVEWRPNTRTNEKNKVSILQLCVDSRCLIIQLMYIDKIPKSLIDFLGNPSFNFFGVGIADDVAKLFGEYKLRIGNAVDLRNLAAEKMNNIKLKEKGLSGLTEAVLGIQFVKRKEVTMSKWDKEYLTKEQVEYACLDAVVAFKMASNLMARKVESKTPSKEKKAAASKTPSKEKKAAASKTPSKEKKAAAHKK